MPTTVIPRSKAKNSSVRRLSKSSPQLVANAEPTADRRTQILQVAAQLFAEFGFEMTSVRQIGDKVNILAGSLYHHFATKEDILHAILREPLQRLSQETISMSQFPVDAEQRLLASILLRFHQYIRDWEVHVIILHDSKFFRRTEDFAYVQDVKSRAFKVLEAILKEGMEKGLFHDGIDTYLMIGTISRMLVSAASWFRAGDIYSSDKPAKYTLGNVIDFYLECVLRMVRSSSRLGDPIPRESCERLLRNIDGAWLRR